MVLGTTLSLAGILILAGIGFAIFRLIGKPKKKDSVTTAAVVLILAGFVFGGTAVIDEITSLAGRIAPAAITGAEAQLPSPVTGLICDRQTDGTNTVNLVYRNAENSSLAYMAASVTAEVNGESQASGTTTKGVTLSYLALNVPPCQSGKVYSLESTGVASSVIDYNSFELTSNYEILGAAAGVIAIQGRDSTFTAASNWNSSGGGSATAVSGAGAIDGNAYYTNTTLASGGSLNFYLDLTVNGTTTAFGAMINGQPASDGVIISFDTVDAAVFSTNSLTLSSDTAGITLKKVACPSSVSANRNAEICWETRTLLSTDGEIRLRGTLKADLGDPTETGDSPVLVFDDRSYFRDTDGDVKYDAFDSAGSNKGLGAIRLTFVMA